MKTITILALFVLLFQGMSYAQSSGKETSMKESATDPAFEKYCEQHALNLVSIPAGKSAPQVAGEITLRDNATYSDYGIVLKESETQYYKVAGSDKVMQVQSIYRLRVGYEASKR